MIASSTESSPDTAENFVSHIFPLWTVAPFVLLLLSIATVPLITPAWWEKNTNKLLLSIGVSLPVLPVLLPNHTDLVIHYLSEYFSFIVLLASLFVISGGIYVKGEFAGTPLVNTGFLAIGAILANVVGTTGASMLLIRPYLRANHAREHRAHLVVFFIFLVCNVGGLLTPIGPPLFMGYLQGLPFWWTLRLLPQWATAVGVLLLVFNLYDQRMFVREDIERPELVEELQPRRRLEIRGGINFLYLLGVTVAILSGSLGLPAGGPEALMIAMALLSWFTTPRAIHQANHFHFHPIAEVAALFVGIFITMIPALVILHTRANDLGLSEPWHYFWMSGGLSSFLDNAPTYIAFTAMASGLVGANPQNLSTMLHIPAGEALLRAISCGSVMMGASTYIGNGPNFMVKSIAERSGVQMPTFGGYMLYSGIVLIPTFILITLVFFR
jgi:Na+/H+ antiporter NhaD/arsenite permease-like protein